ncbi:hypothetical protein A5666_22385 [Mycolicibacterium fortuitum]|nr:hypothetical protein A5665_23865 [Mycolicibacterium fortuitum]OBI70785.1 hypothetical protein A5666_22385 [Mycolicibacterium fortuitum]
MTDLAISDCRLGVQVDLFALPAEPPRELLVPNRYRLVRGGCAMCTRTSVAAPQAAPPRIQSPVDWDVHADTHVDPSVVTATNATHYPAASG